MSDAIESLLNPLKRFHLPVHEIALMLSIALRFVPTLMDETEKIMNAQRARGVDFSDGNFDSESQSNSTVIDSFYLSAASIVRRILGDGDGARGYRGGEGRSKYRKLKWASRDTIVLVVFALATVILIFLRS